MIQIPQGFQIGSNNSIDSRLILTKDEMRNINDNLMPLVYFTICIDDGQLYLYNKNNPIDEIFGRFIPISTINVNEILTNEEIDELINMAKNK